MANKTIAHRGSYVGKAVVSELQSLAQANRGLLMPEAVVEAARAEDSPLHSRFEWDDGKAADKYRLVQARALINISVQYINNGKAAIPTRVFVSLSTDRHTGGYRPFVDVMADDERRYQLLADSLREMEHFQERYKQLAELQPVFETMDQTRAKIGRTLR